MLERRKRGPLFLQFRGSMYGRTKRINGQGRMMINCTHLSCLIFEMGNATSGSPFALPQNESIRDAIVAGNGVAVSDGEGCDAAKKVSCAASNSLV
jgi:hypothetical protein